MSLMQMEQVRAEDLEGAALDWAAATCEGVDPQAALLFHDEGHYRYSESWALAGPLIEQARIRLLPWDRAPGQPMEGEWYAASYLHGDTPGVNGPTALVAAMRFYVAAKVGRVIEVPAQLCHRAAAPSARM